MYPNFKNSIFMLFNISNKVTTSNVIVMLLKINSRFKLFKLF